MIRKFEVTHAEYVTTRTFDEVVAAFEAAVGSIEHLDWQAAPADGQDERAFRLRIEPHLGPSGFTRFLTIRHGEMLRLYGQTAEVVMYTLGNPMIAITMLRPDVRAGLNVPVRLIIYRDEASATTRLANDLPSTLMGDVRNEECLSAARGLDAKLADLAEGVTGVQA